MTNYEDLITHGTFWLVWLASASFIMHTIAAITGIILVWMKCTKKLTVVGKKKKRKESEYT